MHLHLRGVISITLSVLTGLGLRSPCGSLRSALLSPRELQPESANDVCGCGRVDAKYGRSQPGYRGRERGGDHIYRVEAAECGLITVEGKGTAAEVEMSMNGVERRNGVAI